MEEKNEKNLLQINPVFENILKDKVIVVSGCGSGLGKAISLGLIFTGAKIGLLDINKDAIKKLKKEIEQIGGESFEMHASVVDENKLQEVYFKIKEKYGKIDALINNAGIARLGKISELQKEDIEIANSININGYFFNAKIASKYMIENQRGSIINIASVSARSASINSSLYSVAKEAQCAMARSWALDLGPEGIRVNALLLGDLFGDEKLGIHSAIWNKEYFQTKAISKGLISSNDVRLSEKELNNEIRQKVIDYYKNRCALKKSITYTDVLHQIIFLISDLGEKITGESISLSAGNPVAFSK
jgi:NAD(P)-dependent dehydrogenase (short-subunit alcohol dehydrogenase family)